MNVVINDVFGLVLGFVELTQRCMICRFFAVYDSYIEFMTTHDVDRRLGLIVFRCWRLRMRNHGIVAFIKLAPRNFVFP